MKIEALEPRLRRVAKEIAAPRQMIQEIVDVQAEEAKRQTLSGPNRAYKTGEWHDSIKGSVLTAQRGVVGSTSDHAKFVHDGTRYMRARPAIRDAIKVTRGGVAAIMKKHVGRMLSEVGRG